MKLVIATFKETITSLQDLKYGPKILAKTGKQTYWYWTKYFLALAGVGLFLILAVITYFVPQVPKFLSQNFPESQPAIYTDSGISFILDTTGKITDLSDYKTGILVTADKIFFKDQQSKVQEIAIKKFEDTAFDKNTIVNWSGENKPLLWGIVASSAVLILLSYGSFLYISYLVIMLAAAVGIWALSLILKKRISYINSLKLVFYASILPLIVSGFSFLSANDQITFIIQTGLFLIYAVGWLWYLPKK